MKCCIKKFVLFALVFSFVFSVPVTSNAKKKYKEVRVDAIFTPDGKSHNAEDFEQEINMSEYREKKTEKKEKKKHKNTKKAKKNKNNKKNKKNKKSKRK